MQSVNYFKELRKIKKAEHKLEVNYLGSLNILLQLSFRDHPTRLKKITDDYKNESKKLEKEKYVLSDFASANSPQGVLQQKQSEINLNKRKVDKCSDIDELVCTKKKKID